VWSLGERLPIITEGTEMAEEKETTEAQAEAPAKGGKSPKLLVIILLAIVLAGGGFFGMKIMGANKKKEPEKPKVGHVMELQEFLVNLKDKTWLKVSLALGVAEGAELHGAGEGGGHEGGGATDEPKMRDIIIRVLTSKNLDDIVSPEGKEQLKKDILHALNAEYGAHEDESHASSDQPKDDTSSDGHGDGSKDAEKQAEEAIQGPFLEVYFTAFSYQRY
jgi:flagellar FliL protein